MRLLLLLILGIELAASAAFACDPCALYSAFRLRGHSAGTFTISASEQYTDFESADDLSENSVRNGEFVKGFSTTQLALAYDVTERIGVQATVPLVARRFEEIERYRKSNETDTAIGDASLVATYAFLDHKTPEWVLISGVIVGLKFPTGDTGVLGDVSQEENLSPRDIAPKHHPIGTTSGGRALTFGTGSYDGIFGLNLLSRYERFLSLSTAQYTLRTEGDFDYEFADDFVFSTAGGYYFVLDHEFSLAGIVTFSGEFKGRDELSSELVKGSAVSNLYLGPGVVITVNERFGAEVNVDFRITGEDREATVVPETRIRASLSYRFS